MPDEARVEANRDRLGAPTTATWPRALLAATLLPPAALAARSVLWEPSRWAYFYLAVFLASWIGGLRGGIGATVISAALVWFDLVPPVFTIFKSAPGEVVGGTLFVATGVVISVLHGRLRQRNRHLSHAMHELAESSAVLQAVLDYSPNGIIIKDLEGRYQLISKRVEQQHGFRNSDVKGKTAFDLFPPDIAARLQANHETVIRQGEPRTHEEPLETTDGRRILLISQFPLYDETGRMIGTCGITSDITERKRSEEALAQSAADLSEAQRVAHVGSFSWDKRTDSVRWSDELYRIFDRDPSQAPPGLYGADPGILSPESLALARASVEKTVKDGTSYQIELECLRPDGSTRWISARGEPLRDETGEITGVTGTAQDITEIKELQRMREEWTSVIAHDLRQPIGAILMAADFLPTLHEEKAEEKEREFTERIRSSARGLARMVGDLLDLSLLEAHRLKIERRWVSPRAVVDETLARLSYLTADAQVTVVEAHPVPEVYADPMRIGQVLGNLISNAVKYGDKSAPIVVTLDQRGSDVEIAVTNRGRGIEPDEMPRLFGRFVRSKKTREGQVPGLGLGLYIAKGLVEAHGGRLWAESTPGDRTTFHLTLPTREASKKAA